MKQLRSDLWNYRYLVAALLLIAYATWRWSMHGKPERLIEVPTNLAYWFTVRNGNLLGRMDDERGGSTTLFSMPIHGGPKREICRIDRKYSQFTVLDADDQYIYYELLEHAPVALGAIHRSAGSGKPTLTASGPNMSVFSTTIQHGGSVGPQSQRPVIYTPPTSRIITVMRVPIQGGASEKVIDELSHKPYETTQFVSAVKFRDSIVWIRPHADKQAMVSYGKDKITSYEPTSELMITPLGGGPTRKLADHLPQSGLRWCEDGVCWLSSWLEQPARGSGAKLPLFHTDTYRCRIPDGHIDVWNDFTEINTVTLGGRIYWVQNRFDQPSSNIRSKIAFAGELPLGSTLLSARRDGSDVKITTSQASDASGTPGLRSLHLYKGRIYFVQLVRPAKYTNTELVSHSTIALYRIRPGSSRVERLCVLPYNISHDFMDGGYFYFVAQQEQENWFDWSAKGLATHATDILYRYKLQD